MRDVHIRLLAGGRIVECLEYRHEAKGYQVSICTTHLVGSVFLSREPDLAQYNDAKGLEMTTGTDLITAHYFGGGAGSEVSCSVGTPIAEVEAVRRAIDERDCLEGWIDVDRVIRVYKPFEMTLADGDVAVFE